MEYIKKEELIKGEIYKNTGNNIIFKCLNDKTSQGIGFRIINKCFVRNNWFSSNPEYLLATSEEKHWLNECIKLDKFITFEEATKTFNPEYVECIKEVIEPLPQFKVIETIETITKVENNEGNQFFIGDIVISSNGIIQTIESFDYNKAKNNIIAFTNKQSVLGIGIDKIEHYIEPKVEESLLNKAKRLYPVGTKFIARNTSKECIITTGIFQQNSMDYEFINEIDNTGNDIQTSYIYHCIYSKDKWATIIE